MILLNDFRRAILISTVFVLFNPLFGISSALSQEKTSAGSGTRGAERPPCKNDQIE